MTDASDADVQGTAVICKRHRGIVALTVGEDQGGGGGYEHARLAATCAGADVMELEPYYLSDGLCDEELH